MPSITSVVPDVPVIIGDGIEFMLPRVQMLIMVGAVLVVFAGIYRLAFSRNPSGGWSTITAGVLTGAGASLIGLFNDDLMGLFKDEPNPEPSSTPTPQPTTTPDPTRTPVPVQSPADLTWLIVVGGIITALLLLATLVWMTMRIRHSIRAERERGRAEREARQRQAATWQAYRERHEQLLRKITHAETDWDTLFFTPALTDPNIPQTHKMHLAMRRANTLRDTAGDLPTGLNLDADLTGLPYPSAVEAFAVAWDIAETHAQRVGQRNIPANERRILKEIRQLLRTAESSSASSTERTLAYRRAQTLLKGLDKVSVPPSVMAQLEDRQRLMLTETPIPTPGS